MNSNQEIYTGGNINLLHLYIKGDHTLQYKHNQYSGWVDVPPYEEPEDIYRVSSTNYRFRVKPANEYRHIFFHTESVLNPKDKNSTFYEELMFFSYPYYEPSGPHVMLTLDGDNNVIEAIASTTKEVTVTDQPVCS